MGRSEDEVSRTPLLEENNAESSLYENVLSICGFGKFQFILLLICGFAITADSIEILVLSFVLPSACDLNLTSPEKGWLNAMIFVGSFCGSVVFGGFADIKGRRKTLIWSLLMNGVFGFLSSFSPNFGIFILLRFLTGLGVGAAVPVIYTYFVEFMTVEKRGRMSGFLSTFWMTGGIIISLLAWGVIPQTSVGGYFIGIWYGSWRIFVALAALPALISGPLLCFLPESPKYLQMVGDYEGAQEVFKIMYRMNHKVDETIPKEIENFKDSIGETGAADHVNEEQSYFINQTEDLKDSATPEEDYKIPSRETEMADHAKEEQSAFFLFFQDIINSVIQLSNSFVTMFSKPFTKKTLLWTFIWVCLTFGFLGYILWLPELLSRMEDGTCGNFDVNVTISREEGECVGTRDKIYLERFIIELCKLPGNVFFILFIDRVGRRPMLAFPMIICGIIVFAIHFVYRHWQIVLISGIYNALTAVGWNTIDLFVLEDYPTEYRSTAFGVLSGISKLSNILVNVIFGELIDINCYSPLYIIALTLIVGGLSVFKLSKTDNTYLE